MPREQHKISKFKKIIVQFPNEVVFALVLIFLISIFALVAVIVGARLQSEMREIDRIVLTEMPEESEIDMSVTIDNTRVYEDDDISFEYPAEIYVSEKWFPSGLERYREVEFWTLRDDGVLDYIGLTLNFMDQLSQTYDSGTTFDEVRASYESCNLEIIDYTVGGRNAFLVYTRDMVEGAFTLYIPSNDPTYAYKFEGVFYDEELINEIIDLFIETADLKS
ncbi:MAG: hypothetical protein ABIA47_04515 [bacterium]